MTIFGLEPMSLLIGCCDNISVLRGWLAHQNFLL